MNNHLKVLHLTDTHLFGDPAQTLLGVNTAASLDLVIKKIRREELPFDFVLATGDLSQDGTPASYQNFVKALSVLESPVYCLSGNHDDPRVAEEQLNHGFFSMPKVIERGSWAFVLLNTVITHENRGELSQAEMRLVSRMMEKLTAKHVLICLHHHPIPMNSKWLDTTILKNQSEFFSCIEKFPGVRAVLWGHVHQAYDARRGDIRLMSTPSTCFQFKPESTGMELDQKAPGYRWLHFFDDGTIQTGIKSIENWKPNFQVGAGRY